MPRPYSHTHKLLPEHWSGFSLDPPLVPMSDRSDSEDETFVVEDTQSVPDVLSDSVVDENNENANKNNERLADQPVQQVEIQDNIEPERVIEQVLSDPQEFTRPIRNRQTPDRLSYFAPGQSLLTSSLYSINKVPYIPVFQISFHPCVVLYCLFFRNRIKALFIACNQKQLIVSTGKLSLLRQGQLLLFRTFSISYIFILLFTTLLFFIGYIDSYCTRVRIEVTSPV